MGKLGKVRHGGSPNSEPITTLIIFWSVVKMIMMVIMVVMTTVVMVMVMMVKMVVMMMMMGTMIKVMVITVMLTVPGIFTGRGPSTVLSTLPTCNPHKLFMSQVLS